MQEDSIVSNNLPSFPSVHATSRVRHKKFSLFGPITNEQYKMHLTAKCTLFPKVEGMNHIGSFIQDESLTSTAMMSRRDESYPLRQASKTGNYNHYGDREKKVRAQKAASRYDMQKTNWK